MLVNQRKFTTNMKPSMLKFKYFMYLPVINLVISTCALTFQITVLYPWHHKLSLQLDALETKVDKLLEAREKDKQKEKIELNIICINRLQANNIS